MAEHASPLSRSLPLSAILICFAFPSFLNAQSLSQCATSDFKEQALTVPHPHARGGRLKTSAGTLRVPVVFVRFADDTLQAADWPDYRVLPEWAARFVDSHRDENKMFTRGNLSDFFDRASGGDGMGTPGLLQVTGEVFYITTEKPERSYRTDLAVHQHVMARLDSLIDFRMYDNWEFTVGGRVYEHSYIPRDSAATGGDGVADHLFIMWRGSSKTYGPGVKGYIPSPGLYRTNDGVLIGPSTGSVQFDYSKWGSYEGNRKGILIAAHEYCHYIFGAGDNGNISAHLDGRAVEGDLSFNTGNIEWFGLMTANTNGTVSAFERYRAGWLDPLVIERTTLGIQLEDTHVKNVALLLPVRRDSLGGFQEYFLVENIHTTFNSRSANPFVSNQIFDHRIGHGVLVYHIENDHPDVPTMSDIDIECADGLWKWGYLQGSATPADRSDDLIFRMEPAADAKDAFDERDLIAITTGQKTNLYFALTPSSGPADVRRRYSRNAIIGDNEDLFREGEMSVFSPWSNPNSNGVDGTSSSLAFRITGYNSSTKTYVVDVAFGKDDCLDLPASRPQNLRITLDTTGVPLLSWERNREPDVKVYKILRKIEGIDSEYRPIGLSKTGTFRDSIGSLNSGRGTQSILYQVIAIDGRGLLSDPSVPAGILDVRPSKPIRLSFLAFGEEHEMIRFGWEPSLERDVIGYNVYRACGDTSEGNWMRITSLLRDTAYSEEMLPSDSGLVPVFYSVCAVDFFGQESDRSTPIRTETRSNAHAISVPMSFRLSQNYPNPFNPSTVIDFELPSACRVSLIVYDGLGREVVRLFDRVASAGRYVVNFDGMNLASGMYVYRLIAASNEENTASVMTRKMLLLR